MAARPTTPPRRATKTIPAPPPKLPQYVPLPPPTGLSPDNSLPDDEFEPDGEPDNSLPDEPEAAPLEPLHTIADEQRARSEEIQRMGVTAYMAQFDTRDPEAAQQSVPGVQHRPVEDYEADSRRGSGGRR